ncbi:MAG: M14 family zinc carboxypeptidase, partial [Flavobacteriales bacterium]
MIKKILFLLLIPSLVFSQNIDALFSEKGEIYFSFQYDTKNQLNKLSKIISIDHKTNADLAFAYANQKEFTEFLKTEIKYKIIKKETVIFTNNNKNNWNYYPTYQEYIDIMTAFADSFPSICRLHHLGTLNSGREILIVQISNNVGQKENEPSFLYTSSMHGDELAGYILSLRLI